MGEKRLNDDEDDWDRDWDDEYNDEYYDEVIFRICPYCMEWMPEDELIKHKNMCFLSRVRQITGVLDSLRKRR